MNNEGKKQKELLEKFSLNEIDLNNASQFIKEMNEHLYEEYPFLAYVRPPKKHVLSNNPFHYLVTVA